MRFLHSIMRGVAAVLVAACAAGDSVGPSVASLAPRTGSDASAAKSEIPNSAKVYCINESSCFALAYDFTFIRNDPVLGRVTVFSVYVQNLQGTFPSDGPSTPLNLRLFRFGFEGVQESADYVDAYPLETITSVGNVEAGTNNQWSNESPIAGRNADLFIAQIGSGILGCDVAAGNPPGWFTFRTCPRDGLDGWVRVDFIMRRMGFAPSNSPIQLRDFEFWFGTGFGPGQYCALSGAQPETCTVLSYKKTI